jgi:hypothetical protein
MPIEVKHRPAPELQLQMAEYAGQGQYRKWLAEYKAKQEQAKTQAFLSAFGQGSKIGLARRAENQAGAMQTQRFEHESGMQGGRIKAATEAARIKAINDRKLAAIRQTQSAIGAAANAQTNQAAITGANATGSYPITDYTNAKFSRPKSLGGFGGPPSTWTTDQWAKAAQYGANIKRGGTDPNMKGTIWEREFNQMMHQGQAVGNRGGALSAGGSRGLAGSKSKGAFEFYRKHYGDRLTGPFSQKAQEGIKGIQAQVAKDEVIIPQQGTPGTPGYRPAIVGTGSGQSGPGIDDDKRVMISPKDGAAAIRSFRTNLAAQFRQERDSLARGAMDNSWQQVHEEGTPADKIVEEMTDENGVKQRRTRDNVGAGEFGRRWFTANLKERMAEADTARDVDAAPVIADYRRHITEVIRQRGTGETKEEWLEGIREDGDDKWYYGDGDDDFYQMPVTGYPVMFPGIAAKGMSPAGRYSFDYDPNQHEEHWESHPDGTGTRSYRRMWQVAPGTYNIGVDENIRRDRNRMHRWMQQAAIEGGGPQDGKPPSDAWKAYVDLYRQDPDKDIQKQHLNWQARKVLKERREFFGPKGVERNNVIDLRKEEFGKSDMRTLGEVMDLQRTGLFTAERWPNLGPEEKARFRRLFHHLDMESGHADKYPELRRALGWATYTGDAWSDPNVPEAGGGEEDWWKQKAIEFEQSPSLGLGPEDPPPPRLATTTGPEGTDPRMLVTEGYGIYGDTREEVSAKLPSIAKGWGILIGDKMMYLANPDPEALHLKGPPPPAEAPDPNIQGPGFRKDPLTAPAPPPSAGTRLPGAGEDQGKATERGREARSVSHQRAHNAIRGWVNTNGSKQDRQDMIRLDALWKKHGNSMRKIMASKDSRIEYKVIMGRLNERAFIPEAEKSSMKQREERGPMD